MKQKLVVFTGSGISAESGIPTFRNSGALWENYDVQEVATPEAHRKNPKLVNQFYNKLRKQLLDAVPNQAHLGLAALEQEYDVCIITQNIDDLHERAGSTNVMHLHGELRKCRSVANPSEVFDVDGWEIPESSAKTLRPHIVWFGEQVPLMPEAAKCIEQCDLFVIIGTSLAVYPAASLVHSAKDSIPKYFIDPVAKRIENVENLTCIMENATVGVPILLEKLLKSPLLLVDSQITTNFTES